MLTLFFILKSVGLDLLQPQLLLGSRFLKQWCLQTFIGFEVPLRLHLDEIIDQLLLGADAQILVDLHLVKNAL